MKRARSRARVEGLQETYRISWGARRVIQSMAASARPGRAVHDDESTAGDAGEGLVDVGGDDVHVGDVVEG